MKRTLGVVQQLLYVEGLAESLVDEYVTNHMTASALYILWSASFNSCVYLLPWLLISASFAALTSVALCSTVDTAEDLR